MFNQNIISNKFDLNLSTTLSSYVVACGVVDVGVDVGYAYACACVGVGVGVGVVLV